MRDIVLQASKGLCSFLPDIIRTFQNHCSSGRNSKKKKQAVIFHFKIKVQFFTKPSYHVTMGVICDPNACLQLKTKKKRGDSMVI